jgi:UDP-N-acetylglucosamine--N-acetylmuramyl-(pentapeptide) pyrophosphoryl-undecaprenol N-acetylglucosamine transferase
MLAGGGTGGHVYPALAVVKHLDGELRWMGSLGGREQPLVERAGIDFVGVPTGAVLGRGPIALVGSAWRNMRGVVAARSALQQYRPDVVFATGGYVSVPVIVAARTLGIPSALYLPDVKPGLAVAALSRIVNKVACTSEATRRYLPADKVVPTGYPVRAELREWGTRPDGRSAGRAALELPANTPIVVVMGGSSGARSIAQAVARELPRLIEAATVVHIAGANAIDAARAQRERLGPAEQARYRVYEYLHEQLGPLLAGADLLVSRSGASVLGELPAFGLPSVLIPGTFAGGHQRYNADFLASAGAAVRLDDDQLQREDTLADTILPLLRDSDRLTGMRRAARALDRPDAAANIARVLVDLASRKGR